MVSFLMLLFGRIVGLARVTVLPESNKAVTGCPSTLAVRVGVLGGLGVWGEHPANQGFWAFFGVSGSGSVSMASSWGGL